jgi:tetratricopeptide (TPR) repeat protein
VRQNAYLPYPNTTAIWPAEHHEPAGPVCAGCEGPLYEQKGRTPICNECRERFIRYPIPGWIKIFGGAILLLMVFGLTRLPANLSAAIHQKRGERAMAEHRYATAQRELQLAVKAQPTYIEGSLRLLIAAYYNEDYETAALTSQTLEGKKIDDDELFTAASDIVDKLNRHYPSDSLQAFIAGREESVDAIPESAWVIYLKNHPEEDFASFGRAAGAIDRKEYAFADSIMRNALALDPEYTRTLQMMVTIKRELNQFDSAMWYADRLLAVNRELPSSFGTRARLLLKQKKDNEAYSAVQEGLRIDPKDSYCLSTLALVHHFRGAVHDRDALMERGTKDTTLRAQFSYVSDVISGKENFRN